MALYIVKTSTDKRKNLEIVISLAILTLLLALISPSFDALALMSGNKLQSDPVIFNCYNSLHRLIIFDAITFKAVPLGSQKCSDSGEFAGYSWQFAFNLPDGDYKVLELFDGTYCGNPDYNYCLANDTPNISTDIHLSTFIPTPTPLTTTFGDISKNLTEAPNNIANNLDSVTSENIKSFSDLYFEKFIDEKRIGKITFNSALDLSSQDTQDFLKNLGTYMEVGPGSIKFDARTATHFKNAKIEIKMYGLNALGYTDVPPIIVRDDLGNILFQSNIEYPILSDQVYNNNDDGTFTFNTNHFTQFDLPDSADVAIVIADKNALTNDSVKGENFDLSNISIALATLPLSGPNGSSISWESDNASIISTDGQTVNQPAFGDKNADVILTATITKGLATETKVFALTVLEIPASTVATITSRNYFVDNSTSTITNVLSGTTKDSFLASLIKDEVGQIWVDTMINDPVITDNILVVVAQDKSIIKTYTVTVLTATQTTPDGNGTAMADSTKPQVVIINPTQAVNIAIADGTIYPTVDVSSFITNGTGTLPAITIISANANVAIPPSTIVTSADTAWNGVITAPTVTTVTLPTTEKETKTLSTAIEIGFTGAKLSFNKAVRLLLQGQTGKEAGYIRTGTEFVGITTTCNADDQEIVDAFLEVDGECKIDVGLDLVIWTKHFTTFATYTQTQKPTPTPTQTLSNNGGGGFYYATPTPTQIPRPITLIPTPNTTPTPKSKTTPKVSKASAIQTPDKQNQLAGLTPQLSLQKATILGTVSQAITSTPSKFWSFVSKILRKIK